jgi:tRNA threonylcarbamoyl adenosine modification protein YeaZ
MRLLAFDCATVRCVVGVGSSARVLSGLDSLTPRDHMARLLPMVEQAFADAGGLTTSDLDGIVVGIGPGSFTGVRIAVSVAKGLAFAAGVPLWGVPTLDAVAQGLPAVERPVLVLADAARGEVYPMVYRWNAARAIEPAGPFVVMKAEDAARDLARGVARIEPTPQIFASLGGEPPLLAGDALVKYLPIFTEASPESPVAPEPSWYPSGPALLERAAVLAGGQSGDADTVLPIYTRLSDAEEAAADRERPGEGCEAKPAAGRSKGEAPPTGARA